MKVGIGAAVAVCLAIIGWIFTLQAAVGDVKTEIAVAKTERASQYKDLTSELTAFRTAADGRFTKMESALEQLLIRLDKAPMPGTSVNFEGIWEATFSKGNKAKSSFSRIDGKHYSFVSKEYSPSGQLLLTASGTLELQNDGRLRGRYTVTIGGSPQYSGQGSLTPISENLIKGFFQNDMGEFDTLTLTRSTP